MQIEKRLILIVFGMISLFLIAGCGRGGDVIGGAPTTPFLGGSQGLEIKFLEENPPSEVTDGGTFPFKAIVSLRNNGEFKLTSFNLVKVNLIGFLPSEFGVTTLLNNKIPNEVLGARIKDSEGNIVESTEIFVTFPSDTDTDNFNFGKKLVGNTAFIFRAEVCYRYQTNAVAEICVLQNLIDVEDNAICNPVESKTTFSSGSPLRVTSFRQSVAGQHKIQFSFDIVHSGPGNVFKVDTTIITGPTCPKDPTTRRTRENDVKVTVNTGLEPIGNPLNCVGNFVPGELTKQIGTVKLINGRRTITCTQNLVTVRPDFKKSVDITLDFNYLDSTDKEVLVKHLIS